MKSKSLRVAVLVFGLVFAGNTISSAGGFDITDPRWQDAECPFDVAKDFTVGVDVICGNVVVPERHAFPNGPTIQLSVAIFKAIGDAPVPDPVVLFTGGPGGNIFDLAPKKRSGPAALIQTARDIVLMSERGTYGAAPFLDCPELSIVDAHFGAPVEELNALKLQAFTECRERLVSEGVDLEAFTNAERAADVPFVMEVLGYEQYNLWGVSGGGMLTELVVRDHPDAGVRTIMMDSGAFPRAHFTDVFSTLFTNQSARYRLLFQECGADTVCREHYPDLEKVFFGLVERLNAEPALVTIKSRASGEEAQIELTGDLFIAALSNNFGMIGVVPKIIYDGAEGDFDLLSLFLPEAFMGDTGIGTADALYQSVACPEIQQMTMDDMLTDGVFPEIVQAIAPTLQHFFDVCAVWDVAGNPVGELVVSDVPALIMEGAYDTNQPPGYGAEVAENFSASFVVLFGDKAHVTLSECGIKMMAEFMDDPTSRPDTSCVAASPSFSSPKGPWWWILWNNRVLLIAAAVVLLVVFVGGIVWLIRRRRRMKAGAPPRP
jgi:pimeloyl-ACP methyl ester carboxylesterase